MLSFYFNFIIIFEVLIVIKTGIKYRIIKSILYFYKKLSKDTS